MANYGQRQSADGNIEIGRVRSKEVTEMSKLVSVITVLIAVALLALSSGCAREWPDEFPGAYSWQQRSAPLDLLDGQDAGTSFAVSVYAKSRPEPPVSEQQRYPDDRRVPTRLDVVCIDEDGDGFGRLAVSMSLSKPVLEAWHPRTWERWHLQFSSRDGSGEISIDLEEDGSLDAGFIPYLYSAELVEEAMDNFRDHAGATDAGVRVRADFPAEETKPPLEWEFDLGPDSRAEDLLRDLVEICGGVW